MDHATSPIPLTDSLFEHWLSEQLYRVSCPTTLELGEYESGLLADVAKLRVETHLLECPVCRQEVNFLRQFLAAEPVAVAATLPDIEIPAIVKRWVARLQPLASGLQPVWGSLRGAAGDQLVYEVDDLQIMIDVQDEPAQPGRKLLLGLILGMDDPQTITAQIERDGVVVATTPVDELGNFVFQPLSSGLYQLILSSAQGEILLEQVSL